MNVDLQDSYDALHFFETLSPCYSCYHRSDGCSFPALEYSDGMCHMKQQALEIIWNTVKEQPIETYISLPK